MQATVFLLTPPFTQLNTPYPATPYLKGFLNTRKISSFQADLGIEVTLSLFTKPMLERLFDSINPQQESLSPNAQRMLLLAGLYVNTIEPVILFLQGKNPPLGHLIAKRGYLPEASRFSQLDDLEWAFGSMGTTERAKHLATMYLEDIADLIKECIDPFFGFSRYAEKLGRSANSFDELYISLHKPYTFVDNLLADVLGKRMNEVQPGLVAISVPFPGNLYAAFRCAQWVRNNFPSTKLVLGGGFANTELRSVSDPRVFEFFDFITLDDGEAPLERIVEVVDKGQPASRLKRTFTLINGVVTFQDDKSGTDYKQGEVGTPDYSDLLLDKYISAIEVVNPMHRLWSDGRWNKLTMAHGCYWGKCTFCDISLPYINVYEPLTAALLCDRIETLIQQTGENGFHFVDEAAPPALMRALAIEIIRRKLTVTWWTNVRFEKSFTRDLCLLLRDSGCIAVSGGLEVASDRLLKLIEKGITVAQVATVTKNFTDAGIMVHAYLMYGFPTQTEQETVDSLDMVRQLFQQGIVQSGFWHLFTMTAHSPVGLNPAAFNTRRKTVKEGTFANNDLDHEDFLGADHERFGFGLKKSLYNFMHGINLESPLQKWFDFTIPKTTVAPDYIARSLHSDEIIAYRPSARMIWNGRIGKTERLTQTRKGNSREMLSIEFLTARQQSTLLFPRKQGEWLLSILPKLDIMQPGAMTLELIKNDYENAGLEDFELFWDNKPVSTLYRFGLLRL